MFYSQNCSLYYNEVIISLKAVVAFSLYYSCMGELHPSLMWELSAGSEIFYLSWAHHQRSIKPALTDHLPTQTKSVKPIQEPKAT